MEIRSEHRYRFPAPREAVWAALGDVGAYPSWWPWLRRFDARALAAGDVWRCEIRPPLPYVVRLAVSLAAVSAPSLVTARVAGGVEGDAELSLVPVDGGTELRVASCLVPRHVPARAVARLLPGIARRGHDWVFDTGAAQFAAAHAWALGRVPAPAPGGPGRPGGPVGPLGPEAAA